MPTTVTRNGRFSTFLKLVTVATVAAGSHAGHAQDTDSWMSVGASIEYSDNNDRVETGGRDETTFGAFTEFEVINQGRRYDLALEGVLNFSAFENNTFEDEFRGNAFGELIVDLAGESLQWVVQDNFGQLRQDATLPDTPANRENLNVFRTGPRFETRLGRRNGLTMQAFYEQSQYEDSLQDSTVFSGFLSIDRAVSPLSNISLNASARRIEFDEETIFGSYDQQEVYFGWTSNGARTRLDFEAGYSEIHDNGVVDDGHLLRLSIARDVAQRSVLRFDARSELTSTEDAFRFSQQLSRPGLATQSLTAEAEPFRLDYYGLALTTGGNRLWVDSEVFYESRGFVATSANDRETKGVQLALTRAVSENLALGVFADYGEETFDISAGDFDEIRYGLRANYRPTRRVQFALTLSRTDRDTDVPNLSFTENIAIISVSYDVIGNRSLRRGQRADRR